MKHTYLIKLIQILYLAESHRIPTFVARVRKTAKNLTSIHKIKTHFIKLYIVFNIKIKNISLFSHKN